ncbi:WRKY transcription factor 13 [Tripterygium wilfordii]|uniref:WRKY transcription factor 13 n=1 Tax=Tripterygium wilfordii TaxID=458696 RepID=A0A7J7DFK9_TRIWF|nr:probable WRKY transcription factor 13 [Tripterygium wilfordii]KAF5745185.1 WRKY transcription factor 13 [Tripterygium wilfordii]
MLNQQGSFEQQEMGFLGTLIPPNMALLPQLGCSQSSSLKAFFNDIIPPTSSTVTGGDATSDHVNLMISHETLFSSPSSSSATLKQREGGITSTTTTTCDIEGPHLLSLQRSSANLWAWGDVNESLNNNKRSSGGGGGDIDHHHHHHQHLGVSALKMKKIKGRRKVREPRFCFKTMSDVDVLDDGYKWRKYGQKVVKNTQHPRSYYRCTQDNCRVKKRVERLAEDPRMVITSYEGRHAHSPSHDLDQDSQPPSQLANFFW